MTDATIPAFTIPEVGSAVVLVCEDDPDTRTVVSAAVEAAGLAVITAADGLEAKEMCQKRLPDAVVTDIMMPRMTGLDFVKWLRETVRERFIPVLFLTALAEVEDRVQGFTAGGDDYLTKPFHGRELQARVKALLKIKVLVEDLYRRTVELENSRQELVKSQEELVAKEKELLAVRLAGAAAHNLGQPLTSVLLHCHLIEKQLQKGDEKSIAASIAAIRKECTVVNDILGNLKVVDPSKTKDYVGGLSILDLSAELPKKNPQED